MQKFAALILIFLLVVPLSVFASEDGIQWASEVLDVSSERASNGVPGQFAATQALGRPSVLSDFGDTPCAWSPRNANRSSGEFLVVGFAQPQRVQQILVHENFNPGAVSRIILVDSDSTWHTVYEKTTFVPAETGRVLHVPIDRTEYLVKSLRLELNVSKVPGHNQIDAVGIADNTDPYSVEVLLADNLELIEEPQNLGPLINSSAEEISPVISPDGSTLYFVRQNHPGNTVQTAQNIWYAEMQNGEVTGEAKNIGPPLNHNGNSALTSITPDGQSILIINKYRPNGTITNGVSIARRDTSGWLWPDGLKIRNFYNQSRFAEFSLSNSGQAIIMSVQRQESIGGKDLFVTFKQEDGKWSIPESLGPNVNSAEHESGPFLASDDRTLYFATSGRPGYGSADMFVSRRIGDSWTEWTEPRNLGPQLNTRGWDNYYTLPASGEYVYFVSNRKSGLGGNDIYRARLPEALRPTPVVLVRGQVLNARDSLPLATSISYTSLTAGKRIGEANSDAGDGSYSIILPSGDLYGFSASKEGFLPVSENLDLRGLKQYEEVERDLFLVPIESGATIVINNLYFDTGEFDLQKESFVELRQLVQLMNSNPKMTVEITGHTDNVGTPENNQGLSESRAKAVRQFLIAQGIAANRLYASGLGERASIAPNSTEEGRRRNRRVEFKVLEK